MLVVFNSKIELSSIISNKMNNSIKAVPSPKTKKQAYSIGSSLETNCLWLDDFIYINNNKILMNAFTPIANDIYQLSKLKGLHYGTLITTVAGNLNIKSVQTAKEFKDDGVKFNELFYDFTKENLNDYVRSNSDNDFINIIFKWNELRKSEEWYKEHCNLLANDNSTIKREIDLEWIK